ncbi:MAG: cupin domain-containing protein, partial [Solirubrobacterales bacterium]
MRTISAASSIAGAPSGAAFTFGEVHVVIHADAASTGGALGVIEEVPPLADTPLHVHTSEDELFYALEGEHVIQVGDEEHRIGPGETAFGPRGVPHAQCRVVPAAGRILIAVTPGASRASSASSPTPIARASSAPTPMRRPLRGSGSPGSDGGAQR